MSSTRVTPFENLEGQEFNGIRVECLVSRYPVRWQVRCVNPRCGSSWVEDHARIRYIGCRNSSCGRESAGLRATMAQTGQVVTATRSRDSESARAYQQRQSTGPAIRWGQPSQSAMLNADPDSMRRYLDYTEAK